MDKENAFMVCLALTLSHETAYRQPPGGPYLRHADGSTWVPKKPDGLAYDDDPRDSGGRTCMGIIQREYDAWRRSVGQPPRDVWLIEDRELELIYYHQYWKPVCADQLPPGLDFITWDYAVNSGCTVAVKKLQRALGVSVDGHIGMLTLAAAQKAQAAGRVDDVVNDIADGRERFYRSLKTFPAFGHGWLTRNEKVRGAALRMVTLAESKQPSFPPVLVSPPPIPVTGPDEGSSAEASRGKATPTQTGEQGQQEAGMQLMGGYGTVQMGVEVGRAATEVSQLPNPSFIDILLLAMQRPMFWTALFAISGSITLYMKHRKAKEQEV